MSGFGRQQKRIVPWVYRRELQHVYTELYSDNIAYQRHAVDRITAWKSRALMKLPIAIECTASFVSANMDHQRATLAAELNQSDLHLRQLYSMALIRFVNHITEKGQNRQFAVPVHVVASQASTLTASPGELCCLLTTLVDTQFGVPEWIVELRHQATHGGLPSLSLLRAAAKWALQWLKMEFWEKQVEGIEEEETPVTCTLELSTDNMAERIREVVARFQQQKLQEINTTRESESLNQATEDLDEVICEYRTEAFPVLLEDGLLISTETQLAALNLDFQELMSNNDLSLPDDLQTFWRPFFKRIRGVRLSALFLQSLLGAVTEEETLRNRLLYGWAYTMINHNELAEKKTVDRKSFYKTPFVVPYKLLLDMCIKVHNPFSYKLLQLLIERQNKNDLTDEKKSALKRLIDLQLAGKTESSELESKIYTINDVITDISEEGHSCAITSQSESPWKLCTDPIDWAKHPIGLLPNQIIGFHTFDLYQDASSSAENENQSVQQMDTSTNGDFEEEVGAETAGTWNEVQMSVIKSSIKLL